MSWHLALDEDDEGGNEDDGGGRCGNSSYQSIKRMCGGVGINLGHCSDLTQLTVQWRHRAWFNACGNHNGCSTSLFTDDTDDSDDTE